MGLIFSLIGQEAILKNSGEDGVIFGPRRVDGLALGQRGCFGWLPPGPNLTLLPPENFLKLIVHLLTTQIKDYNQNILENYSKQLSFMIRAMSLFKLLS